MSGHTGSVLDDLPLAAAIRTGQGGDLEHPLDEHGPGLARAAAASAALRRIPRDDRFYGISGSHLDLFRCRMDEVTRAEVNAAVRKYLQYGKLHIVFVTPDAEGLKQALVADAPSPITYATPKSDAVLAEDRQISVFPLKIQPDAVTIIPVGQLFENQAPSISGSVQSPRKVRG